MYTNAHNLTRFAAASAMYIYSVLKMSHGFWPTNYREATVQETDEWPNEKPHHPISGHANARTSNWLARHHIPF